jgi:hypothetical protein
MYNKDEDIVAKIIGKTSEKDEYLSSVSEEDFKSSIENTLNNLKEDLKELEILKAEAMQEAMQDGFIVKKKE